ncbi:MAG: DUF2760 domain-containing protein [Polyangiaceae bacterium]|nr:DUF2760 domain-containing protein [Polyangiaceae bacterium]
MLAAVTAPVPFSTRLWLAWVAYFRILFDGAFAARVLAAREGNLQPLQTPPPERPRTPAPTPLPEGPDPTAALVLLGLLQREGRLVDFLKQDITTFGDAEVGAAARVVHEGCRRALHGHIEMVPVRSEPEGEPVTLEAGFDPTSAKLTGAVGGSAPYRGVLRHRGWRAEQVSLPRPVGTGDATILAPAEVEL